MYWITHHVWIVSIIGTWILNNIVTVMVTSLPAPTKDSSQSYIYWFKVLNTIIGNIQRARSTTLENSPNWEDAIAKHDASGQATKGAVTEGTKNTYQGNQPSENKNK